MESAMRILVVGGTGLIGGDIALRLKALGHDVAIAARKPAPPETGMAQLPFHRVDYVNEPADTDLLAQFDTIVFAAGNDIRHAPAEDEAQVAHWDRANSKAVPRYFAAAKEAGVRRAILIGSFYPQAAPYLVATNSYVASRQAADEGARALADDKFHVVVLNAPIVMGYVPGLPMPAYEAMASWGLGVLPIERFAIGGGSNIISTDTLTDSVVGALDRGENGKAYLIGDENLTFQDFFGLFFKAAGDDEPFEVRDQEHPLLPDFAILAGRGNSIYYDTDPAEVAELRYRQNDIARTVGIIVDAQRAKLALPA